MASSNPGGYLDTRATETSPLLPRRESSEHAVGSGSGELSDANVAVGAGQNVGSREEERRKHFAQQD